MLVLRSALFNAWFFGMTFLLGFAALPMRWFARDQALEYARFWARVVLAGARVICGIRVTVTGLENLPPGPALIASQHQSAFDTLIWMTLVPRPTYVYKAELARIPLFGPMLIASGQIALDRAASIGALRKFLRGAERAKADGRQIIIFPEGTRVTVGQDVELRGGFALLATRTGLPITPAATDSGLLWSRRAFRKQPGSVHIHIGKPIAPDLPQAAVIQALRERWREAGLADKPVDKFVD